MRGKEYDMFLVAEFCDRMTMAERAKDKGDAIRWFCDRTGASSSTAYRVYNRAIQGMPINDIAQKKQTRKPRKSEIQRQRELQHARIISAVKIMPGEFAKQIPTELAITMAENMGHIPKGMYTRSTMDRLLAQHDMNAKSYRKRPAGMPIRADYPGQVVVVDATPMDQYYMTLDMNIRRYDAPVGDKHLDDVLAREGLYKIWVYYLVDLHSKAFLVRPYAELPKTEGARNAGESADTWLDFLLWCFRPKRNTLSPLPHKDAPLADCPIEGLPVTLYCDRGSGIGKSNLVGRVCTRLGIQIVTHMPHNPRAKGMVESRIGAFKRRYETLIQKGEIDDVNKLIYFYQAWCHHHNKENGLYDVWQKGVIGHPIVRVSEENIHDAMVSHTTRRINDMGCISVDAKTLFVTHEEKYIGTRCSIYRPPARNDEQQYLAELFDGTIINNCVDAEEIAHKFDEIKRHPKTAGERNREDTKELSKSIGKYVSFEDTLPQAQTTNIVRLPSPATTIETHSPVTPASFASVEHARRWILNQTGMFMEEIEVEARELIEQGLALALKTKGHIPGSIVVEFANLVNREKSAKAEEF